MHCLELEAHSLQLALHGTQNPAERKLPAETSQGVSHLRSKSVGYIAVVTPAIVWAAHVRQTPFCEEQAVQFESQG